MKTPRMSADFYALKHCARSGNLVIHLEKRKVWDVSQDFEVTDGLRVVVYSDSAEFPEFETTGILRFDERHHQWFIEFTDDDIEIALTQGAIHNPRDGIEKSG